MKNSDTSFSPYIGITDFMSREQTLSALDKFYSLNRGHLPHKLMIGVMMSYKTLHGLPTKWTAAFPSNDQIADIFVANPLALNTLHYADYTNTDVCNSLTRAIEYGGDNIEAIQLDMVWPDPDDISNAVQRSGKSLSVILQVGQDAMAQADDSPKVALERMEKYTGIIDGVLFDRSMGQGKIMDPSILLKYLSITSANMPRLRLAVAGGLGPDTIAMAKPLVSQFPDLSIDAQGRLRPSGSALEPIDWSLADKYLEAAVNLFTECASI